jgi:hypothetical protein
MFPGNNLAYEFRQFPTGLIMPELFAFQMLVPKIMIHLCRALADTAKITQLFSQWYDATGWGARLKHGRVRCGTESHLRDFRLHWNTLFLVTDDMERQQPFDRASWKRVGLKNLLDWMANSPKTVFASDAEVAQAFVREIEGHPVLSQYQVKIVPRGTSKHLFDATILERESVNV